MKYLVNRETKEHVKYDSVRPEFNINGWRVVEADAEGWIKWDRGNKSPLPCHSKVELLDVNNFRHIGFASGFEWIGVKAYRPILDKPEVTRPTASEYQSVADSILRDKRDQLYTADGVQVKPQADDIITRLKSAHEAAQSIPDLLAELREALVAMGYDVVARSPFVPFTPSGEFAQPPADDELTKNITVYSGGGHTEPDMSDWRNWREGDFVEVMTIEAGDDVYVGETLTLMQQGSTAPFCKKHNGEVVCLHVNQLRFHSRPE